MWPWRAAAMEAVGIHAGGRVHATTASVKALAPEHPCASVAVTVKGKLPAAVGVPESTPEEPLRLRPAGRTPAVTEKVYGAVPPLAEIVWPYATDTDPLGSDGGDRVIVGQVSTSV